MSEREQTEIAAAAQSVEAANIDAQKSEAEITPEAVQASMSPKANADLEAAMAQNQNIEVAAADAQEMKLTEQDIEVAENRLRQRQGAAGHPFKRQLTVVIGKSSGQQYKSTASGGCWRSFRRAPTAGGGANVATNGNHQGRRGRFRYRKCRSVIRHRSRCRRWRNLQQRQRIGGELQRLCLRVRMPMELHLFRVRANPMVDFGANIARTSSGGNRPTLGSANGQSAALTGRGEGRQANAVGTTADAAGIAMSGTKGTTNGEALIAGPANTSVDRSKNGLTHRGRIPEELEMVRPVPHLVRAHKLALHDHQRRRLLVEGLNPVRC